MKQPRKFATQRRGAAAIEAALVLPFIFMFLFGVVEYSRYLMTTHMLRNAARQGAEYAAIHTSTIYLNGTAYGNTLPAVTTIVNNAISGNPLVGQTVTLTKAKSDGTLDTSGDWTTAAAGQYVCVQIKGTYQFLAHTLLKLPASMNLTIQAVRRSEGN